MLEIAEKNLLEYEVEVTTDCIRGWEREELCARWKEDRRIAFVK
jgi:hypothetical protein